MNKWGSLIVKLIWYCRFPTQKTNSSPLLTGSMTDFTISSSPMATRQFVTSFTAKEYWWLALDILSTRKRLIKPSLHCLAIDQVKDSCSSRSNYSFIKTNNVMFCEVKELEFVRTNNLMLCQVKQLVWYFVRSNSVFCHIRSNNVVFSQAKHCAVLSVWIMPWCVW